MRDSSGSSIYMYILFCIIWMLSTTALRTQNTNKNQLKLKKDAIMKMQTKITGSGTPIVLVPGGLTGWISWEPHAERLSSTRKVVRVQLLNVEYGFDNRQLPSDYSVKTESLALAASLDELGLTEPLDIVAWSYGADITLDFALDNPERIHTLTLIEPPALWVLKANGKLDDDTKKIVDFLKTLDGDITEEKLENFLKAVGFLQPGKTARELPQWEQWIKYRQSLRNSPAVAEHNDNIERLKSFNHPVLLVKGTGSAQFLHKIIDALAMYLPQAKVIEMPAGHAPQIASFEKFLEKLQSFIVSE